MGSEFQHHHQCMYFDPWFASVRWRCQQDNVLLLRKRSSLYSALSTRPRLGLQELLISQPLSFAYREERKHYFRGFGVTVLKNIEAMVGEVHLGLQFNTNPSGLYQIDRRHRRSTTVVTCATIENQLMASYKNQQSITLLLLRFLFRGNDGRVN